MFIEAFALFITPFTQRELNGGLKIIVILAVIFNILLGILTINFCKNHKLDLNCRLKILKRTLILKFGTLYFA